MYEPTFTFAFKGDKDKYNEIKQLLIELGGEEKFKYDYKNPDIIYFVSLSGIILSCEKNRHNIAQYKNIFTIDEFYKQYPFKVGERVKSAYGDWYTRIIGIREIDNRIGYRTTNGGVNNYINGVNSFEKCQQFKYSKEELQKTKEILSYIKGKHEDEIAKNTYDVIIKDVENTIINNY